MANGTSFSQSKLIDGLRVPRYPPFSGVNVAVEKRRASRSITCGIDEWPQVDGDAAVQESDLLDI